MPSSDSAPDKNRSKDVILTQNTDDFIIGDRVWVNGTNPGYIQYIGETQFSPGDWAGVVLDDCSGKNDGSVSGVRYFQCEAKRGVFARLHKLTRYPLTHYSKSSDSEGAKSPQNGSGSLSPNRGTPPPSLRASTPTRAASPGGVLSSRPKVGDRVIVNATSGSKLGYLRYLGSTDFAPGDWAGVELDEPLGKNNGTVAGKRYFDCTMKFGLFAPAHKITKATGSSARDRRQGSHESLNSSLSSGTGKSSRSTLSTTLAATNTALQGAVREKEKHIDQLLKERDLERAEVIRASAQVDEVEQQLGNLQKEHRKYVDESEKRTSRLRQLLEMAETERRRLARQLDDEKRKVEDLQFRIEEESITKDDLEVQTEHEKQRIEDLQRMLEDEKRTNRMLSEGKNTRDIIDDAIKRYKEESESFRQKLKNAESRIRSLETTEAHRTTMARSQLQEDLIKKEEIILQTQLTLDNKKRELSSLQDRLAEMERELEKYKVRQEKHLGTIDGLNLKLQKSETLVSNLSEELHTVKINLADSERRLEANEETCRDLLKQRSKLQEQVDSLMESNSANENTAFLTQELREKERLVEELEHRLQAASQEAAKSRDTEQSLREQHQMELKAAASGHEQAMKTMKEKYESTKEQLQAKEDKISSLSQASSRLESKIGEKMEEIERLKGDLDFKDAQLSRHEARLQEADLKLEALQGQASLQQKLSMTQAERDILKVEKEEALKRLQVAEENRQRLIEQREQWSRDRLRIQSEMEDRENQVIMLKKEVERLQTEFSTHRQDLVKKLAETKFDTEAMEELQMQIESQRRILAEVQRRLEATENERDVLHEELVSAKTLQEDANELEKKTSSLQQELDDVKKSRRELEKELESLHRGLEATQILLEQREQQISVYQQELSSFRAQQDKRERNTMNEVEKKQLENKIVELQVALARLQKTVNVPDSEHQKVLAEKEALENQVDFLNSVIVDMQKKNDDLKGRLEILETEVIFDGQVNITPGPQHATSRLFCDVCDVFDLHDTDDCLRHTSGNRRNYERLPSNRCEESEMF